MATSAYMLSFELYADPGTGAALQTRGSGQVDFTIAASASETNTLGAPDFVGQILVLTAGTVGSGGSRAVTASVAINQAGNTIMTFGAARDTIVLRGVSMAGTKRWIVEMNNGVDLS